jgi:hypothetical protein
LLEHYWRSLNMDEGQITTLKTLAAEIVSPQE